MHIFPFLWSWIKFWIRFYLSIFPFVDLIVQIWLSLQRLHHHQPSTLKIHFFTLRYLKFSFYRHLLCKIHIHHSCFCLISSRIKNVTLLTLHVVILITQLVFEYAELFITEFLSTKKKLHLVLNFNCDVQISKFIYLQS